MPDYFVIRSQINQKVVDARFGIVLTDFHNSDHQLWFKTGQTIRPKNHPSHVLDLDYINADQNGWARILLWPNYHGGPNQRWKIKNDEIVSQYKGLRLDVKASSLHGDTTSSSREDPILGCNVRNAKSNHKWTIWYPNISPENQQ